MKPAGNISDPANRAVFVTPHSVDIRRAYTTPVKLYTPLCIIDTNKVGRSAVGYSPFIIGTDKVGRQLV